MKNLIVTLSVCLLCWGCQYTDINYFYIEEGGLGDGGVTPDGGDIDTDSEDTDADTDTDTDESDAGADSGGLGCLEGDYAVANSLDVSLLLPYECVTGELWIQAPGLVSIDLPNLKWVEGDLRIVGNMGVPEIMINNLSHVDGNFGMTDNNVIVSVNLASLTSVVGTLGIYSNASLPNCGVCAFLSQLTSAPATIDVQDNLADSCTPVPTNCP